MERRLTNAQMDRTSGTREILADAHEFACHNQYIANFAPLQLYASALVFDPDLSIVKTLFKPCMPYWLLDPPRIEESRRSDTLVLRGYRSPLEAIAFSHDDKLLGTCALDGTVSIWDTTDANCLLAVCHDEHDYYPNAIAFSSDNSKIAVAWLSAEILQKEHFHDEFKTWNKTVVFKAVREMQQRDRSRANTAPSERPALGVTITDLSTNFMDPFHYSHPASYQPKHPALRVPDIVAVFVAIYNTKTGTLLRKMQRPGPMSGRLHLAVAFEDDHGGNVSLALSGSDQIQVWRSVDDSDILIRAWGSRFPTQSKEVQINIGISQDASLLCCSGFLDKNDPWWPSIRVLDARTGDVISRHSRIEAYRVGGVNVAGIAPVCQVRRGARDLTPTRSGLMILDVKHPNESTHLCEFTGTWGRFSLANAKDRVAFNPTGDDTVYVEAISNKRFGERRLQQPRTRQVAVAPGENLVADWHDGHLDLLDTQGVLEKRLRLDVEESLGRDLCLALSPDCQYIAVGYEKGTTVLNIGTGKLSHYYGIQGYPVEKPETYVQCFSSDNRLLASAKDGRLSLWDLDSETKLASRDLFFSWLETRRLRKLRISADGKIMFIDGQGHDIAAAISNTESSITRDVSEYISLSDSAEGPKGSSPSDWVQLNAANLMWIPPEYRPYDRRHADAQGHTVALGQEDGSVLILKFTDPVIT